MIVSFHCAYRSTASASLFVSSEFAETLPMLEVSEVMLFSGDL